MTVLANDKILFEMKKYVVSGLRFLHIKKANGLIVISLENLYYGVRFHFVLRLLNCTSLCLHSEILMSIATTFDFFFYDF